MNNLKLKRLTLWTCSVTIIFLSLTDFVTLDYSKNKDISYFLLGIFLTFLIIKSKKETKVYRTIFDLGISAIVVEAVDYFLLGLNTDYYFGILYLAMLALIITSKSIVTSLEIENLNKRVKTKYYIILCLIFISGYLKHYLS